LIRILLSIAVILALASASAVGCAEQIDEQDNGDDALVTGSLTLNLADAPIDAHNVTGVYITINEIQYHLDGEWKTFEEFEGPKTYDLLELSGGNSVLLGEFTLPAGHYTQIRFMLDVPEIGPPPANPGCYIEFDGGESVKPLFVPSGAETGYKAIGQFTVPVNGEVEVTADFDVRKSVFEAYSVYVLNPTIRLVVNDQGGSIVGSISNGSEYTDIIVFAYEEGTWNASEAAEPGEGEPRFPNAVTSGKMDDEGDYVLAFLAAGTYELVVAGYNGADFGEVLGYVANVEVESGPGPTVVDVDTDDLDASL